MPTGVPAAASRSLPLRERGLKYHDLDIICEDHESLPLRERGLKYGLAGQPWLCIQVAPFTGAWIEIVPRVPGRRAGGSLPLRERGLKLRISIGVVEDVVVAPFTGAWIEIWNSTSRSDKA